MTTTAKTHFARPHPSADGRTPVRGMHPCANADCDRMVARFGSHPHSDGGRGSWKHVVVTTTEEKS